MLTILVLALVSGLLAGFSALRLLRQRPAALQGNARSALSVAVAARDLPLGTVVTDADVKLVRWPEEALPAGYVAARAPVLGRGTITAVRLNEPLLEGKLAPRQAGGGLAIAIPPGMRAMSVKVDEVVGVAGFVLPGTRVDVVVTITPPGDRNEPISRVVLQNIQALAAGQRIQTDADGKPVTTTVITLLVRPEDAEKLALAAAQGRIQLALRNTVDVTDVPTAGARVAALLANGTPAAAAPRASAPRPRVVNREPAKRVIETYKGGLRTLVAF